MLSKESCWSVSSHSRAWNWSANYSEKEIKFRFNRRMKKNSRKNSNSHFLTQFCFFKYFQLSPFIDLTIDFSIFLSVMFEILQHVIKQKFPEKHIFVCSRNVVITWLNWDDSKISLTKWTHKMCYRFFYDRNEKIKSHIHPASKDSFL